MVALLFGCFSFLPAPTAAQETEDVAVLRPGDLVQITVWRQPEFDGEFEISGDGTIEHPVFGNVVAGGVPLDDARLNLERFLREQYDSNPQFLMRPLFRVAVGGEVRQPNLFALSPQTTLAQAVAMAGGPTERGRLDRVYLIRGGGRVSVDLTDPASTLAQSTIRSGDQLLVERDVRIFRDYIAPASSVTGALVALLNVFLR